MIELLDQGIKGKTYSSEREFPLRIFGSDHNRYVCCPYELHEDRTVLRILEDKRIAHLELTSIPESFRRHMLFSYAPHSTLITASGYLFEGPVRVSSWKVNQGRVIDPSEKDGIDLLASVDMIHVKGDDKNETAGFEDALRIHKERLIGLRTREISIKEAVAFYRAMQHHVPRS